MEEQNFSRALPDAHVRVYVMLQGKTSIDQDRVHFRKSRRQYASHDPLSVARCGSCFNYLSVELSRKTEAPINGYWVHTLTPSCTIEPNTELLGDCILGAKLHCHNCSAPLGYKILDVVYSQPPIVPLDSYDNQSSGIASYKNNLIFMENQVNAQIARIKHGNRIKNLGGLIGKYLFSDAMVQITPLH